VGLNSRCFAEARRLERAGGDADAWRRLCRAWSSDLRTHVTDARWQKVAELLPARPREAAPRARGPALARAETRRAGRRLFLETEGVRATLNLRRGLALEALTFAAAGPEPLLGTLPHGTFDDIRFAADFYSGHTVLDVPGKKRITDLEACEPEIEVREDALVVSAQVPTALGALKKRVVLTADCLRLELEMAHLGARPLGSLRAAHVTLHPEAFGPALAVTASQGGAPERFPLDGPCDHTRGVPPLVTASAAFGCTDGVLVLDDGERALELRWDPARAAALPLLFCVPVDGRRLVRVAFSLAEVDDTFREGAPLHDFALELRARRIGP